MQRNQEQILSAKLKRDRTSTALPPVSSGLTLYSVTDASRRLESCSVTERSVIGLSRVTVTRRLTHGFTRKLEFPCVKNIKARLQREFVCEVVFWRSVLLRYSQNYILFGIWNQLLRSSLWWYFLNTLNSKFIRCSQLIYNDICVLLTCYTELGVR